MKIKVSFLVVIIAMITFPSAFGQIVIHPNFALKSHETLDILKVECASDKTILYLELENRIEGGTFCADKNIYLLSPDAKKLELQKAVGIPTCPETYKFKGIGEKLQFTLEFPPLKAGTKWVDVVEDCNDNCFWFYGLTLDNELNKRLDDLFDSASKSKSAENIILFSSILNDIDNQNQGIEGLIYINIINAALEDGDKVNAMVWYKRLASSNAPRAKQYIKYLNDKGISF